LGWVDPGSGWHGGWFGHFADEAFRVCVIGAGEDLLSRGVDGVCLAVMDLIAGHQADAGMVVVLVAVTINIGPAVLMNSGSPPAV